MQLLSNYCRQNLFVSSQSYAAGEVKVLNMQFPYDVLLLIIARTAGQRIHNYHCHCPSVWKRFEFTVFSARQPTYLYNFASVPACSYSVLFLPATSSNPIREY